MVTVALGHRRHHLLKQRIIHPTSNAVRMRRRVDLLDFPRQSWAAHLTPQDSQGFRPHVTVQNKVDPATVRATVQRLQAAFVPFTARAQAVVEWRYVGGPWELVRRVPFAGGDVLQR